MKKLILITAFILFTQLSFAQWNDYSDNIEVNWGTIWCIDAVDSNIVVSYGNEPPVISTNNGETWYSAENYSWYAAMDISFIDSVSIIAVTIDRKIVKTTDLGYHWDVKFENKNANWSFNYIEMFDENNGIAMADAIGDDPVSLLNTTDGGETWNTVENNLNGAYSADFWRRIDFVNPSTGYFYPYGMDIFGLLKTTDGGENWSIISSSHVDVVKFYNENIGLITASTADSGYVERTLDGGETWQRFEFPFEYNLGSDFEFLPGNPAHVWFTETNNLFYSNDTGRTWTQYNNFAVDYLEARDIQFVNQNEGWLACDDYLYHTNNNGNITTAVNRNEELPREITLYQNYPNPFNPTTSIKYQVARQGNVTLKIYDVLGNEVTTLVNEQKSPGIYKVKLNAGNLTSGVYFYTLKAGEFKQTKKLLLLK